MSAEHKNESRKQINSAFAQAGPYLNIAYFFMGSIALLGFAGDQLDEYLGFDSIFLLAGLFSGLILGFYHMYKVIRQIENNKHNNA